MQALPGYRGHVNVTSGNHSHVYVTDSPTDGVRLEPEFLRVEDAAAILRLSEREIYRLITAGDLRTVPYGRRKLIEPSSVTEVAAKIRAGGFAEAGAAQ